MQWQHIDIFVYFSHSLVTIPPPGWVATAHAHGAQALGTFITEWGPGRGHCTALFASPDAARATADQLVAIAVTHGFEGGGTASHNGNPASSMSFPDQYHAKCARSDDGFHSLC